MNQTHGTQLRDLEIDLAEIVTVLNCMDAVYSNSADVLMLPILADIRTATKALTSAHQLAERKRTRKGERR